MDSSRHREQGPAQGQLLRVFTFLPSTARIILKAQSLTPLADNLFAS